MSADPGQPVRRFQRYTSEQRASHAASHRLSHRQRSAVGEFFWTHPDLPGVAFGSRGEAVRAAEKTPTEKARQAARQGIA